MTFVIIFRIASVVFGFGRTTVTIYLRDRCVLCKRKKVHLLLVFIAFVMCYWSQIYKE